MFKRSLKRIYHSVVYASGVGGMRIKRLKSQGLAPVLNLHRVSPESSDYWPPLSPMLFEELLVFLKSEFHLCRIGELDADDSGRPVAALSFDDGYYDFIEYAMPLLGKHRVPANMNVIPHCAISGKPIWNVQLYDFLHSSSRERINALNVPGFSLKLDSDRAEAKVRFGAQLSRHLKNRSRHERDEMWRSIEPALSEFDGPRTRIMTTEELRHIAGAVDLGAHSFSHESMGYEDLTFFQEDLRRCQNYFENELGQRLTIYAFPNGSYRPEQVDELRGEGIKHILLVGEKLASRSSDVLTRITIYGDTGQEVKMKSLGF